MSATYQEDDINMSDTTTYSTTLDIDSDNEQKTSQQQKKRKTSRYSPYQSQNTSNKMTTTIEKTTKSSKSSLPPTITNMTSPNTTQTKQIVPRHGTQYKQLKYSHTQNRIQTTNITKTLIKT